MRNRVSDTVFERCRRKNQCIGLAFSHFILDFLRKTQYNNLDKKHSREDGKHGLAALQLPK